MKRISIFATIVFILMVWDFALSQEKIDAPIWNVGDRWTYQTADGKRFTNSVVKVDDEFFVVRMGGSPYLQVFDRKTMTIKKWIDSSGTEASPNVMNIYDFPLFVRKKWGGRIHTSGMGVVGEAGWEYSFRVEDIEGTNTIAGSFKAYRLYAKVVNLASGARGGRSAWIKFWYSPEAKVWIKREVEKSTFWQGTRYNDTELVSYELKR
jgi:hypothetical protein